MLRICRPHHSPLTGPHPLTRREAGVSLEGKLPQPSDMSQRSETAMPFAAHVIAYYQNKYSRGAYKPMAKEFHEGRD